ncbi:MAG: hypothetical protein GXP16_12850 [Gammaproteobacteria bacterium]|nr:hypothetical protein [Gammaproteobacteria bacterium]
MRQPLTVTIKGENLSPATSISGLPRGVKASIIARGNCGIRVSISVPSSVCFGSRGIAVLKAGRQNSGARFHYSIRPIPRSTGENRTYMELFTPRVANRATRNRTGNTNTVDLRPTRLAVNLYKAGSATTADGLGNTYTALNPFDNSAFCQGIQEGGLLTTQTTYYTQPGTYCVTWFQRATGVMTVDTTASCVGVVNSLARGQVSTFSYARPQSQTTVAKVGLGTGCYHTGLSSSGWNDNQGYSVHVDTGNDVSESREDNNVRQL